jgi:hypothetical protein
MFVEYPELPRNLEEGNVSCIPFVIAYDNWMEAEVIGFSQDYFRKDSISVFCGFSKSSAVFSLSVNFTHRCAGKRNDFRQSTLFMELSEDKRDLKSANSRFSIRTLAAGGLTPLKEIGASRISQILEVYLYLALQHTLIPVHLEYNPKDKKVKRNTVHFYGSILAENHCCLEQ